MARDLPLVWTTSALDELDEIAARIASDKPSAAASFVERALAAVDRLREFPDSGRRLPELPNSVYRELIVAPCRIVYRPDRTRIIIVHVVRGERLLRRSKLRSRKT